jgi:hypothetical protein
MHTGANLKVQMWTWEATPTSKWNLRQDNSHHHRQLPGSCETVARALIDEIWKRWVCKPEMAHHHRHPIGTTRLQTPRTHDLMPVHRPPFNRPHHRQIEALFPERGDHAVRWRQLQALNDPRRRLLTLECSLQCNARRSPKMS